MLPSSIATLPTGKAFWGERNFQLGDDFVLIPRSPIAEKREHLQKDSLVCWGILPVCLMK